MPADVRPKKKGSPAKFSWQTILILRIAVLMRDQFKLELQAQKSSFANLREELRNKSLIALWGQRLALGSDGAWTLIDSSGPAPDADVLLLQLDPHLRVLCAGFALPDPTAALGQLDLFSLPNIHRAGRVEGSPHPVRPSPTADRRSA